jgi:hypothetical protein
MSDELKLCPMCGNDAILMECSAGWWVECSHGFECGVSLGSHNWTQDAAVAKWNARATEDALRAQLAEAVELLCLADPSNEHWIADRAAFLARVKGV